MFPLSNSRHKKTRRHRARLFSGVPLFLRYGYNVDSTKLTAVFGIGLGFESNLLPFFQRTESFRLNCGEMHEYVVSALVGGNETVSLTVVEPSNVLFIISTFERNVNSHFEKNHAFCKYFSSRTTLFAENVSSSSGESGL